MDEREASPAAPVGHWIRIDSYIVALARRRRRMTRSLKLEPRSEPENPRLMLSTLPFLALLAVLGVLMVAFFIAAWPPSQPGAAALPEEAAAPELGRELGNAPRGWFQEAAKEFSEDD
jgi:hypothetical protein